MIFIIYLILLYFSSITCHLNVFISQKEVKKIMGLSAELYYVRDGVVNTYAMNFEVPVSASINELEFCWQSLTRHSLPYSWDVESNNGIAMKKPELDIPQSGWVPSHVESFHLKLLCTGVVSAEVRIQLVINITAVNPKHNDVSLIFKRVKICLKTNDMLLDTFIGKDESLDTNRVDYIPSKHDQQHKHISFGQKQHIVTSSSTNSNLSHYAAGISSLTTRNTIKLQERETPEELISTNGAFYFALGCGSALIITLIAVTSGLIYRHSNKLLLRPKSKESFHTSYTSAAYIANPNMLVRTNSVSSTNDTYATIQSVKKGNCTTVKTMSSNNSHVSPYATSYVASAGNIYHVYSKPTSPTPSKISYYACTPLMAVNDRRICDNLEERILSLSSHSAPVKLEKLLLEGAFSKVYQGTYQIDKGCSQEVFVKTVTGDAASQQVTIFLSESLMLHGISGHLNILQPIAVCQFADKPPSVLYPFSNKGNLKKFLYDCKRKSNDYYSLTTQDIVDMGVQLCLGCVYLHSQGICHRDISARNCVVDEKLRVKLSDSGLSRDLFPEDYSCLDDNENRPIKWMALESILLRTYNGASDVWSFGVLLWELVCLGTQPYGDIDPYDLSHYLQEGYRLSQPINCPDDLFGMMTCCWLPNPEERPSSAQVLTYLQDFHKTLNQFI
ncbi:tyrosine-protein kinase Dnt-like [Daktulosphaira vitifoliae]|uniref:tyrosine-protein kinase Dnt-like n=1 Tax=Daktulosphaira vitifoliae TaxID=58002 RepID=UPI0021AAD0DF|nr:tyrosine-protein kinase Dnt-like [Daktulosphaira vitifoliae]XP_050520451.1 tyrosine-protein kinase Dnt-like [Daktulosphaira vitifoliae]